MAYRIVSEKYINECRRTSLLFCHLEIAGNITHSERMLAINIFIDLIHKMNPDNVKLN